LNRVSTIASPLIALVDTFATKMPCQFAARWYPVTNHILTFAFTALCALTLSHPTAQADALSVEGVHVVPHVPSSEMRYRQKTDISLRVRVEIFLRNASQETRIIPSTADIRLRASGRERFSFTAIVMAGNRSGACWTSSSTRGPLRCTGSCPLRPTSGSSGGFCGSVLAQCALDADLRICIQFHNSRVYNHEHCTKHSDIPIMGRVI
jgi:hypothetical protein